MEKQIFNIPNISCNHCVKTIIGELSDINGILKVNGDSKKKQITVEWEEPVTLEKIKDTLEEINYPAKD